MATLAYFGSWKCFLQKNINNSVVVIIVSLFHLSNTSAGSNIGTENPLQCTHPVVCAHLNTHMHALRNTLYSYIGGSWPLSGAVCPLSCVIVLHTQYTDWVFLFFFSSTASLKLRTTACTTAHVGVSSIRSIENVILNDDQLTNDASFSIILPRGIRSVSSL